MSFGDAIHAERVVEGATVREGLVVFRFVLFVLRLGGCHIGE